MEWLEPTSDERASDGQAAREAALRAQLRGLSAGLAIRRTRARAVRLCEMDAVLADARAFDAGAWHALAGLLEQAARHAGTPMLDAVEHAVLLRARAIRDASRGRGTLAGSDTESGREGPASGGDGDGIG